MELGWEAASYPIFESCQGNSEESNWVSRGRFLKWNLEEVEKGEGPKEQTAGIKQKLKARGPGGPAHEQSWLGPAAHAEPLNSVHERNLASHWLVVHIFWTK